MSLKHMRLIRQSDDQKPQAFKLPEAARTLNMLLTQMLRLKSEVARISILYGTHCSSVEYESARAAGRIHIGMFESEDSLSLRLEQSIVEPDSIFLVLSNQTYSIQFELLKV